MNLLSFANDLDLDHPIMLLAMSGWVDAASVGTDAIGLIADDGEAIPIENLVGWAEEHQARW